MGPTVFPQRALYGNILETNTDARVKASELYTDTDKPFSGIVYGVQVGFHIQYRLSETLIHVRLRRALERAILPLSFWKVASFVTNTWVHFQNH